MSGFGPREPRIGDGPYCDKAWHVGGDPVPSVVTLRCAVCGRRYARCAACQQTSPCGVSMRAHMLSCYDRDKRRRVLPGRDA